LAVRCRTDGILLRGAVGFLGSEDPWIVGPNGTKYGLNTQGDLVIQDTAGDTTFVANYQGGPDLPTDQQTAGIFVGRAKFYSERLLDLLNDPHPDNIQKTFKIGNELLYVRTGMKFFNADPLVFDLSGTGIDLTAQSEAAPMLDMRGNGFAVHTGWVGASNGILVLQQAGQNGTPPSRRCSAGRARRASRRSRPMTATTTASSMPMIRSIRSCACGSIATTTARSRQASSWLVTVEPRQGACSISLCLPAQRLGQKLNLSLNFIGHH
jgi:hypothetical protein